MVNRKNLNRYSELIFKNGKALPNRVVVPSMASETASLDGFVTDLTLKHYTNLSESKAGLVMVEYTFVHLSGRSEENQLGIHLDQQIEGLRQISKVIKKTGSLAGIQLTHAGGKTTRDLSSGFLMTPSSVPVPVKDQVMEPGEIMSLTEIALWKNSFLEGAIRASEAGFDLIELHAAHGYGLNQWLSPITNHRSDSYGGTHENRIRLLLEIIREIKTRLPDILLSVRMPGQDFLEGGLRSEDTQVIARELERVGGDIINVSSGIGGWRRPRDRIGQGYLLDESSKIQAVVSIPVIGVGGIEDGSFIDEALQKKQLSLAAVGRAILKSPKIWSEAHLTNSKESTCV